MEPLFQDAEKFVRKYFQQFSQNPEQGSLTIGGERYILVRASSLSVEFFEYIKGMYPGLNEIEAAKAASSILFDMAHALGKADAMDFHRRTGVNDPLAKLSSGPIHFAYTGWANVDIFAESRPSPDENYYLIYDHPNSFEADSWIRKNTPPGENHPVIKTDIPVCFMNAGYSSGWCEQSFSVTLTAREILCRASGDDCCRFIMGHPKHIHTYIQKYKEKHGELFRNLKE
jgi:hypothetical protein